MIRDLAGSGDAVVAALTVCEEPGVIEACRAPRQRGVAVVATRHGRHMMQGLRGRAHAVMTATALFPLQQVGVLHARRHEGHCRVARGAVVIARNVFDVFARRGEAIVATDTASFGARVIHPEDGCEVVAGVTEGAVIDGRDVPGRLGGGTDAAADRVASLAGARRTLEYSIDMAVLARHVPVRVAQLESRRQVIETRALNRLDGRVSD